MYVCICILYIYICILIYINMYIDIYIYIIYIYVCMCVPRLRFFCLKASLPDDMLSSESMSSSINKPLELSL